MRYLGVDIPDEDYQYLEERKWQERTSLADQVREAIADYRKKHPIAAATVTVPNFQTSAVQE